MGPTIYQHSANGIRTRVWALRGPRPSPLDDSALLAMGYGPLAIGCDMNKERPGRGGRAAFFYDSGVIARLRPLQREGPFHFSFPIAFSARRRNPATIPANLSWAFRATDSRVSPDSVANICVGR